MVWVQTECIFPYRTYIVRFPSITANNKPRKHRGKERERERMKTMAKITTGGNEEDTVRVGI
jgi:hypothetical protein